MRDPSAPTDTLDVVATTVDHSGAPTPAVEAPPGLDRRTLVGRAGLLGAGAMVLASGALAPAAATAATAARDADPGSGVLPTVASVRARLESVRLVDLEILELAVLLQVGDLTSVALTTAYLERIDALNGSFEVYGDNGGYNAFVRIDREGALAAAKTADERLRAARSGGPAAPYLCGIPLGVKDSIGLKDRPAQNGTVAFKGNVGNGDATAMARLREQGVVFLGHTICSAFSGSTTGSFAGNAWNKAYVPGGSSQGSGVAPIARLAAGTVGEETGGSIMFPSAANGASGIKPSLGLSSVAGVMPLRVGVDVIGPISRSMKDSALILNAMVGADAENDPQTLSAPLPREPIPLTATGGGSPLRGRTIGIPQTDWMGSTAVPPQARYDADYLAAFDRLRGQLEALGATVIDFPGLDLTVAASNPYHGSTDVLETVDGTGITPLFAASYPDLYEIGFAKGLEQFATAFPETRAALLTQYGRRAGGVPASSGVPQTFSALAAVHGGVSAGARREGLRRRRQLAANYQQALDDAGVDFMLVMTIGAKIGLRPSGGFSRSRTYYQVPNVLGWPMVSFPIGYGTDADGLPISAQFWGTRFSEPQIVQAAIDYQAAHPEHHRAVPTDIPAISAKARRLSQKRVDATELDPDPLFSNDPDAFEAALPDAFRPH